MRFLYNGYNAHVRENSCCPKAGVLISDDKVIMKEVVLKEALKNG